MATQEARWKLDLSNRADPDDWNEQVAGLGGGLFHNHYYAETIYGGSGEPFYGRFFDSEGRCVGGCLGTLMRPRPWPIGTFFKQAHLTAIPATLDATRVPAALAALARALSRRGAVSLTVDSYGGSVNGVCEVMPSVRTIRRAEFQLDLQTDLEAMWRGLAGRRRTQIRRAEREGLTLREGWNLEDAHRLASLIDGSAGRSGARNGEPFEVPGGDKIDRIWRHLVKRRLATVFLAEKDGAALSANLVGAWNRRSYNVLAGSSPDGFKIGAASWLYWEIIKKLKAEGAECFNLGGVAPDGHNKDHPGHGLYNFKRDFGGELISCRSVICAIKPLRQRWYRQLSGLRRRIGKTTASIARGSVRGSAPRRTGKQSVPEG